MGFFDKVKKALGGAKDAAENAAQQAQQQVTGQPEQQHAAPQAAAAPQQQEEELSAAQEEWRDLQQLIARVESGQVPLNGVDPSDAVGHWKRVFQYEELQGQGLDQDQAAQKMGFAGRDHWDTVNAYVGAKWSELTTDEDGDEIVRVKDEYTNAAMQARMGQMQGMQAAAAAADPNLLAPVDGVSVDQWAGAAATLMSLGGEATPQQVAEALAKFGLDKAKYDAANAGWQAKMQGDTTGAIATKYGEAFTQASAGAGVAGAAQAASGQEPVSFEKYVEVMAAQSAWAEQGLDIQAQLKQTFGIEIGTYSAWAAYWSPKMATDIALSTKYSELEAKYKAQYSVASPDDDLSF